MLKKSLVKSSGSSDRIIGVGVQVSILKFLQSGGPAFKGIGINGLFSPDGERNAFFGEFNYYLKGTQTSTVYGNSYSSSTSPTQIDIQVNTVLSGYGFSVGYRRYIIKDISEDGFKMYFQAAIGLLMFKGTSTADGYDKSKYGAQYEPESTATGFTIGGGIGAEYCIGSKINIFVDGNLNIPANSVNGESVDIEIPITVQPKLGFRYHF